MIKEKNQPYKVVTDEIKRISAETSIVIVDKDGEFVINYPYETALIRKPTKVLYDGRYCAVSGFIFTVIGMKIHVLANKRGPGCPDFQGYWNCPCGFLERSENSVEGILREIQEECAIKVPVKFVKPFYVETEPSMCNNGNVTIRHFGVVPTNVARQLGKDTIGGGEQNEVKDVKWIPLEDVDMLDWAFNHKQVIHSLTDAPLQKLKIYWKWLWRL